MLIATIIRQTVSLQGFKIKSVSQNDKSGITVELAADRRYRPRYGVCQGVGKYKDTRASRHFRHVPM